MTGEYNNWSSFPTWRVWNDILGDIEFEEPVTADDLLKIVYDVVISNLEMTSGSHLVEEYARIFIALPNYEEIANAINFDLKH